MKTMTYKGYGARIEYSEEDGCFVGHLADIRDIVGFHAKSEAALERAFRKAVADYLAGCKALGQPPDKSGAVAYARFAARAQRGRGQIARGLALLRKASGR